ncbi:vanadium-dependent haloperoxidase [Actinoplanes sp. NPDC020271]|uniref:vanadium-dependent haloperoxidase n=1 Tax=Actinoplanes sp. NPDC020271 TaxID=3363896 RepID=UPI0037B327DC
MKKLLLIATLVLAGTAAGTPAAAHPTRPDLDSVRVWNELTLSAVRVTRAGDADAARLYAMVDAAIFDAVNGLRSGRDHHRPVLVAGTGPRGADPQAAAAGAAHAVLVRADAERAATYDAQLAADLARLGPGTPVTRGAVWGDTVGIAVVDARAGDGSRPVETQTAGAGPGVFRADWSGVQYRNVRPFAVADPARYLPGPPPALTSAAYVQAFDEVKTLGDGAVAAPDLLATYQFWSLPAGSVQPPGEWLRIALTVSAQRRLPLAEQARLTALLTVALADTTIPTVAAKFTYRHWRPTTAIREAGTDGNAATVPDPAWTARAGSVGGTPEYVSGHSAYSRAAATVLAGYFRTDRITFTHATDTAPGGVARTYPGFSAAADEAGRSRIYGGQHFPFSDVAAQTIGRGVATEVLTRLR